MSKIYVIALLGVGLCSQTHAQTKCDVPPYGATVGEYRSFIKNFGPLLDDPSKMLRSVCRIKFGGADRSVLYNLGFTPDDIDSKDVGDIGVQLIMSLKNLADKTK